MSKARFIYFNALKSAVTMEQVLIHYGVFDQFKLGRDSLTGPCPIHKGTHPTQFRVSISKNCWRCFSDCHSSGNVLDFVVKMEKVSENLAASLMVKWFKLDVKKLNAEAEQSARKQNTRAEAKKSVLNKPIGYALNLTSQHPYFAERGLTPETVKEFRLGYCDKGTMAGRILVPIYNIEAELVGYAGYRPGAPPEEPPKYWSPSGFKKESEVYGLVQASWEPKEYPLIIVQEFFDVMKLWQIGVRKAVALMDSSMSAGQEQLITRVINVNSTIVLMFNGNNAGRAGQADALRRLAPKTFVRVMTFADEDYRPEKLTAEEADGLGLIKP